MFNQYSFILIFLLILSTGAHAQSDALLNEKVSVVNDAVLGLYAAYSFENGDYPANEDILSHFTEEAKLSYITSNGLVTKTAEDFFDEWQKTNRDNGITTLQEVELNGRTEVFKSIAHRISAVEFTLGGDRNSTGGALISLQLFQVEGQWKVHTMLWQSLGEEETMPERFRDSG